jgi:hypothetical protein
VVWQTSDGAVVSVADGVVIAAGVGDATITATVGDQSVSLAITIAAQAAAYIPEQKMALGLSDYGCSIASGTPTCWGSNQLGQWGNGTTTSEAEFASPVTWGIAFEQLASGARGPCGLTPAGAVYCWGENSRGQLGPSVALGDTLTSPTLVPMPEPLAQLSGFNQSFCGVSAGGTGYCWGYNNRGQLGDGTQTDRSSPVEVSGGHRWAMIAVGSLGSCGIDVNRQLWCWGTMYGSGTSVIELTPVPVAHDLRFTSVSAAARKACAVTVDHEAYCWGAYALGDGTNDGSMTPVRVAGGIAWRHLFATAAGCGIDLDGAAHCWSYEAGARGTAALGIVGDGQVYDSLTIVTVPTRVSSARTWEWLGYFGRSVHCGVDSTGDALCWGVVEHMRPCLRLSRVPTSVLAPESECDVAVELEFDDVGVFEIGGTVSLRATTTDAVGDTLRLGTRWESLNPELFTVDSETGVLTAVSEGVGTARATRVTDVSADVTVLVEVPTGRVTFSELHAAVKDLQLPSKEPVTVVDDTYLPFDPEWSPDGTKLVFVGTTTNRDIMLLDAASGVISNLTQSEARDRGPSWSPDGSKITFVSPRDGPDGLYDALYTMNADGSAVAKLTEDSLRMNVPAWSPDGTRIAFSLGSEVHVINTDGTGRSYLTDGSGPRWSPDGTRILFFKDDHLWTIGPDGSGLVQLPNSDGIDVVHSGADWSPDGRFIAAICQDEIKTFRGVCLYLSQGSNSYPFATSVPTGTSVGYVTWRD